MHFEWTNLIVVLIVFLFIVGLLTLGVIGLVKVLRK